ncbi:class II glutamine amidotransferase [Nocardioides campestrisoli]|uniref:class II glutamine amidotransferase n=1 Tax=Nocardioides campestrisoli TaxID=2736757 RepID=UPI00163D995B|nr:class II glutamine amidotransferase [Nocardioides campestrisoli]
MCRLLGYVRRTPTSVEELLGPDGLEGFTALTAVHADGWGMAWQDPEGSTHSVSSPGSAATDPEYAELVRKPLGRAGFVHLRWATGGLPVRPENTHPFVEGDYAFAHNGHVSPIGELESLLKPETREALVGDTDSERYFRFVKQSVDEHGDVESGVRHALGHLLRDFPDCSLNALMLTPTHMVAIHVNSRATSPRQGLRDLFDNEDDVPPRHLTEYFAMDYRTDEDGLTIISSGLDEPGWTAVPDDMAVMVDLETLELTRLDPVEALAEQALG